MKKRQFKKKIGTRKKEKKMYRKYEARPAGIWLRWERSPYPCTA